MKNVLSIICLFLLAQTTFVKAQQILVNQIGYDINSLKRAIFVSDMQQNDVKAFEIVSTANQKILFKGLLKPGGSFKEWGEKYYYNLDFSGFNTTGEYIIQLKGLTKVHSPKFKIGENLLAKSTLPSLLHYFRNQRANTNIELENDKHVQLFGSSKTVDLAGGWCDASGDVSKYFSHLAYANFMSPQQIPLVTYTLIDAANKLPKLLKSLKLTDSIKDEAVYGADYLVKSLSDEGYFYMIVFSYFNKDPKARRVVGLHANSVTTSEYQCAFREGGGMAIAALAKISTWENLDRTKRNGYIDASQRAYEHLKINNLKYCDDGKENIIDDYCALMAATELYQATKKDYFLQEARTRVQHLQKRLNPKGYFISDDTDRPYFHASDAGLPLMALNRYLAVETDKNLVKDALRALNANLAYQIKVTSAVENPFGYARQTFKSPGGVKDTFFIPQENETGWWWQGENARLASLAAAAFSQGNQPANKNFATNQLNWILGLNPYNMCFMYGFGEENVPYMASNYGHGSQKGGISNGITGKDGAADGSGIDFKKEASGNEWRWTEQWLPHAAWFLQAITELEKE
ncbi:glycoside hydrolase family 9 protein [Pedobacter jeongneungensis]|uniref:Glycoside hydrolase family 9 protein n=1 Tax=Pedobacter jeongneungensis TaxID=947309 RepID=A0ABP8BFD7_9SPHI